MRILCVCLGNICRSPMAEGAIRKRAAEAGLEITVDSAGTGAYHLGQPPDLRGLKAALARGYDNGAQRARQVGPEDFHCFDLILAMDSANLAHLRRMAPANPPELRLFDPQGQDIPDPYHGGPEEYEHALDMVEAATDDLIATLRERV
ncbi:MAG: low molecular weight protein-tyrosine-phosphatase [Pseudomonadota bacterium]